MISRFFFFLNQNLPELTAETLAVTASTSSSALIPPTPEPSTAAGEAAVAPNPLMMDAPPLVAPIAFASAALDNRPAPPLPPLTADTAGASAGGERRPALLAAAAAAPPSEKLLGGKERLWGPTGTTPGTGSAADRSVEAVAQARPPPPPPLPAVPRAGGDVTRGAAGATGSPSTATARAADAEAADTELAGGRAAGVEKEDGEDVANNAAKG